VKEIEKRIIRLEQRTTDPQDGPSLSQWRRWQRGDVSAIDPALVVQMEERRRQVAETVALFGEADHARD
jgi:hypothetical protein